nr:MFS transporter [Saccharopolyspora pogona]
MRSRWWTSRCSGSVRSPSPASATFLFAIGFFSLLLGNVLFLTGVWHLSVVLAGAAATPGPIAAALCAPVAGRLADRFGQRAIAIPGTVLFTLGALTLAVTTTAARNYVGVFLPAALLTGIGVGFTLPAFGSAGVAQLPPARFATGIGVTSGLRQIGAVIGIAGLIAVLSGHRGGAAIDSFHRAWLLIAGVALLALLAGIALGRIRPGPRPGATAAPARPVHPAHD